MAKSSTNGAVVLLDLDLIAGLRMVHGWKHILVPRIIHSCCANRVLNCLPFSDGEKSGRP